VVKAVHILDDYRYDDSSHSIVSCFFRKSHIIQVMLLVQLLVKYHVVISIRELNCMMVGSLFIADTGQTEAHDPRHNFFKIKH